MFIAGGIGIVVGAIVHSNHSNYGDYYSEYSDADVLLEIRRKKSELEKLQRNFKIKENLAKETLADELKLLKEEMGLPENEIINNIEEVIEKRYKELLEAEIGEEQAKVNEIDETINKILTIQLKK